MLQRLVAILVSLTFVAALAASPNTSPSGPGLSATQIVDKNVAARGGLQAWRAVQTITMEGKMGVGGNQRATLSVPMRSMKSGEHVAPQRPAEEVQS